jgi:predicted O-methyltransferase YrrM
MVDGMDENSKLISVDNDAKLIGIANAYFGADSRLQLVCEDGAEWIKNNLKKRFDLIFADAWPGKYGQLDEVLNMVKVGGYYVIDDMSKQPNWPSGHDQNVKQLIAYLEDRNDFQITKMNWSTGLVLAVRKY